jgi:hypothetical protein
LWESYGQQPCLICLVNSQSHFGQTHQQP